MRVYFRFSRETLTFRSLILHRLLLNKRMLLDLIDVNLLLSPCAGYYARGGGLVRR